MKTTTLPQGLLKNIDAYWRAANYLSVGQIYLYDNPLLKKPLKLAHIKPRLLGHWGTTPGLNFIYVHLNRVINERELNAIYITGPGHGGPGLVANAYLEGTYSEVYPNISQDAAGMQRLFKQFSFPAGIPSHVAPETPGSIHEGGELGYSLSHAFGAAFDNPDLLVACVVGDGEAETGPLATSWHSNKFLNPVRDGAVLPILHLNGYKIAGPTVLARIPHAELEALFRGYGYTPYFVEGNDPMKMHELMARTLDTVTGTIQRIQRAARKNGFKERPRWPMIILRSPKGWTGPKFVDGKPTEDSWRSHQVPMGAMSHPGHVKVLEKWLKSYRPRELFDPAGKLRPELAELAPAGARRMSANPHANGGSLLRDLRLPDFRRYAVKVSKPGGTLGEATRVQGEFIRDVIKGNPANFRVFSPDETNSNRWGAVFEVTDRCSTAEIVPGDDHVTPTGRVMEVLSEHQCEGWLEGYLLTGRHGFFSCYEAFIHIVDSMFNQHAKWLAVAGKIPWRRPIASLNYLLSSHVWRQDHNGFSHQDPGFIDVVANKKAEVVRIYLPPDANTLLSVTAHCLRSRNYVNVIVAGKQPQPQWLDMDAAIQHCTAGIGIWPWASNDQGSEPNVVMACCGDVPTLETLAAVDLLRRYFPHLKVRVINVVDLMKLQPQSEHPHGLSDKDFDGLFTKNKPIIFAYHGYPTLIHRLTYRRTNHKNLHVRGFKEEGTTSTPFDMVVMNDLDRFHLVADVMDRVPALGARATYVRQALRDKLIEHKQYIAQHGEDLPEDSELEVEGEMSNRFDYDVAILGGGSAGYAAARATNAAGLQSVVIEGGEEVGGLCILRGCMPTKALLYAAEVLHRFSHAEPWGIHAEKVGFDFAKVMARKNALIQEFANERREQLASGKLIRATARFLDPHTVALSNTGKLTAKHFVITTGSTVAPAPLAGLREVGYLTSDDVMKLTRLPKSLIVLGGGAVAVELAQFFARFGVKVTILQRGEHILREFDTDAGTEIEKVFRYEGIEVFTNTKLTGARRDGVLKTVLFEHNCQPVSVAAEEILFALGRVPNTASLDLDKAGVAIEHGRIVANDFMQTSAPHIYTAGDCTGPHDIVHLAVQQGEIAAHNIAHPEALRRMDYRLLVGVMFTEPQVAFVGLTEKAATERGVPYRMARYLFSDHGKALIMEARDGFVKLLADPQSGEILGGACVGPVGGELIHEIVVAMAKRMTVHELAALPHYHPTLAEIWTYPAEALAAR